MARVGRPRICNSRRAVRTARLQIAGGQKAVFALVETRPHLLNPPPRNGVGLVERLYQRK